MVLIPIGTSYSATIEKSQLNEVLCERCQCHFVYFVRRTGTGSGMAPLFLFAEAAQQSAESAAYMQAEAALRKAVDLARCPKCGGFQEHMVTDKRWRIFKGTAIAALVFVLPTVLFAWAGVGKAAIPETGLRIGAALGIEALVFAAVAVLLVSIFNPNAGRLFPYSQKDVVMTDTYEKYQAAVEEERRAANTHADKRAEEMRQYLVRQEAENSAKREQAQARKEAEMRKLAERAKGSEERPLN
ncbi:hypothetical protein ANRL1_00047 [Anaerolineae bacterium]|nr:hypothetical protein ANRL1_00047 [Anaerolineae bacterium]